MPPGTERFSGFGRAVDVEGDGTYGDRDGLGTKTQPARGASIALRDGLRQTALDNMALIRAIRRGVDVDGDGSGDLRRSGISYYAQSLGGIYGTMLMGADPTVKVGVLNVPGGPILEIARLSPGFRCEVTTELGNRRPSLLNGGERLRDGRPGFTESTPLYGDPPVTAPAAGALAHPGDRRPDELDRPSGSPETFAPLLRLRPPGGQWRKRVLYQFAFGDQTVPNPTSSTVMRAGQLRTSPRSTATTSRRRRARTPTGSSSTRGSPAASSARSRSRRSSPPGARRSSTPTAPRRSSRCRSRTGRRSSASTSGRPRRRASRRRRRPAGGIAGSCAGASRARRGRLRGAGGLQPARACARAGASCASSFATPRAEPARRSTSSRPRSGRRVLAQPPRGALHPAAAARSRGTAAAAARARRPPVRAPARAGPARASFDVRRVTLRRRGGRFTRVGRSFYRRISCGLLTEYKLGSPGVRRPRPPAALRIAFRVALARRACPSQLRSGRQGRPALRGAAAAAPDRTLPAAHPRRGGSRAGVYRVRLDRPPRRADRARDRWPRRASDPPREP